MAMWLSKGTGLPFALTVKWAPILADSGLTVLIFHAILQSGNSTEQAFVSSLLCAFNPVSMLVTAYHGQFNAESAFSWLCPGTFGISTASRSGRSSSRLWLWALLC